MRNLFSCSASVGLWTCSFLALLLVGSAPAAAGEFFFVSNPSVAEGDSGSVDAVFTVSLLPPRLEGCGIESFRYATVDVTATAGIDYGATSGAFTLDGCDPDTPIDIPVPVFGDVVDEGVSETFLFRVTYVETGTEFDGTGTIVDDDAATISIADSFLTEGDNGTRDMVFTVSMTSPFDLDVPIDFATADGTATAPADYRATSGRIILASGATSVDIVIPVEGELLVEADETFAVDIALGPGGPFPPIVDAQGIGTIVDDDSVEVSIADTTVVEGDSGTTDALFTVSLSGLSAESVFVDYRTSNGTGKAASDYRATSGRISIAPGDSSATISVPVFGDLEPEGDESFFVDLSGAVGASLARTRGVATIVDDDGGSILSLLAPGTVSEGGGAATLVVERTGDLTQAASVVVDAAAGTATAGQDFTATTETLVWGAGVGGTRTLELPILDDNEIEGSESVVVTLSQPAGAALGTSTGELTINDDDEPQQVQIVGDPVQVTTVEETAELTVRVLDTAGEPIQGATVEWSVDGDARLLGEPVDATDSQGESRQSVELGEVPGRVVVTATLTSTGQSIQFDLTAEGNLRRLFPSSGLPTGEASVAGVLDLACIDATGQFGSFCDYLFTLPGPGDQLAVLGEVTPEETPAQATISMESAQTQLGNITARLKALHGAGTRQAIDQLALTINGRSVPWQAIVAAMAPAKEFELPDFAAELAPQDDAGDSGAATGPIDVDADAAPRLGFFVNGRISMGSRDETSSEEGFDVDSSGITTGIDYRVSDRFIVGGALGFLDTDLELVRDGGALDAEGYSLAVYSTYFRDRFYLDTIAAIGRNDYEISRHVDLGIPFQGRNRWISRATPSSDQLSLALSSGFDRVVGASTVSLFAGASYVEAQIDEYRESGGGPFDLILRQQDVTSLLSSGGLEWNYASSRDWGILQPTVRATYLHEFDDDSRLIRGRFVGDVTAGEFVLATDTPDRDYFNLGAGLTFVLPKGRSIFVYYDADLERSDLDLYTLSFGARWEF